MSGFNEAAAFFAAEELARLAQLQQRAGFNEAAAFFAAEGDGHHGRRHRRQASMRPRRFSPRKTPVAMRAI